MSDKFRFSEEDTARLIEAFGVEDVLEHSPEDVAGSIIAGMEINRNCLQAIDAENKRLNVLLDAPVLKGSTCKDALNHMEAWLKEMEDYRRKLRLEGDAEARLQGVSAAVAHLRSYVESYHRD